MNLRKDMQIASTGKYVCMILYNSCYQVKQVASCCMLIENSWIGIETSISNDNRMVMLNRGSDKNVYEFIFLSNVTTEKT